MQTATETTSDFLDGFKLNRRFPRKPVALPTGMINGNAVVSGTILDIGPGGVRISTKDYVPGEGQLVTIKFRLDTYANWGYLHGRVVWVEKGSDLVEGETVSFGLEWSEQSGFDPRWLWFLRFPYFPN